MVNGFGNHEDLRPCLRPARGAASRNSAQDPHPAVPCLPGGPAGWSHGAYRAKDHQIAKTFTAIERMMIAALLVALSLLFFYSGKLGLSWRSRIAGVAVGFVLFLSFNVVSAFFRGNAPPWLAHLGGSCGQLSYLYCLGLLVLALPEH
jgi:hypothetical protein